MMLIGRLIPFRGKDVEERPELPRTENAVSRFHSEVDRLFERFFGEPFLGGPLSQAATSWAVQWNPTLDIYESDDAVTVRAEVPGVEPKDLDISVSGDVLSLSGEKKEESEQRGDSYFHTERRFGSFRRDIALPAHVDRDKITAEYDKGILTVRLAKLEKAVARRIPVAVKK